MYKKLRKVVILTILIIVIFSMSTLALEEKYNINIRTIEGYTSNTIIDGHDNYIEVTDNKKEPVKNMSIAISTMYDKDELIENPSKYKVGDTDKLGKFLINDRFQYYENGSKIILWPGNTYIMLIFDGDKNIKLINLNVKYPKYKLELGTNITDLSFNQVLKHFEPKYYITDIGSKGIIGLKEFKEQYGEGFKYINSNKQLGWKSLTPDIIQVNEVGEYEALGEGTGKVRIYVKEDPNYYIDQKIYVYKNIQKTEFKYIDSFGGNYINEKEEYEEYSVDDDFIHLNMKLESKENREVKFKDYIEEAMKYCLRESQYNNIEFNDDGELIKVRSYDDMEYPYNVIVNGKYIEKPENYVIKEGDKVILSRYPKYKSELKLEILTDIDEITVNDDIEVMATVNNKPVKDVKIYLNDSNKNNVRKELCGKTDKNGKLKFVINETGKKIIFAEKKDSYIPSDSVRINVKPEKGILEIERNIKNNEEAMISGYYDYGKFKIPVEGGIISYISKDYKDKTKKDLEVKIAKLDYNGKVKTKLNLPEGEYILTLRDINGNLLDSKDISIKDNSKLTVSTGGKLPEKLNNLYPIKHNNYIYLFGGEEGNSNLDRSYNNLVYRFDVDAEEIEEVGKIPKIKGKVIGHSYGDKIYIIEKNNNLGGNRNNIYEYDPKDNSVKEIGNYDEEYSLLSDDIVLYNGSLYYVIEYVGFDSRYSDKYRIMKLDLESNESIIEFEGRRKGNLLFRNGFLKLEGDKLVILGGEIPDKELPGQSLTEPLIPRFPIMEYNLKTNEISDLKIKEGFSVKFGDSVDIGGDLFFIRGVKNDKFDIEKESYRDTFSIYKYNSKGNLQDSLTRVGYLPRPRSGYKSIFVKDKVYIFGGNFYNSGKAHREYLNDYLVITGFDYEEPLDDNLDTEKLELKINELEKIDKDIYTKESILKLEKKLKKARELLNSKDIKQEDIDNMYKELVSIKLKEKENKENLEEIPGKEIEDEKDIKFSDIDSVPWAKDAIIKLAERGIIEGVGDYKYEPNRNITRAEFSAFIVRFLDLKLKEATIDFYDVLEDDWYYEPVKIAYSNVIIRGRSKEEFDPNTNINRQEVAVIISRILKSKGLDNSKTFVLNKFIDYKNIYDYALESVEHILNYNIIEGYEDGSFKPLNSTTRAEAALIVYRLDKTFDILK